MSLNTVLKLLKDLGCAVAEYHNAQVRNLKVRRVQCDEIWAFVYAKQKNVTAEQMAKGAGDIGLTDRVWKMEDLLGLLNGKAAS